MPATAPPPSDDRTVTLRVEGMECASCSARVERVLSRLDGVAEVGVNLATERATVRARPGLSDDVIAAAIRKAGFGAETEAAARDEAERAAAKDAERDRQRQRTLWAVALTIPIWLLEMVPMLVPGGHGWLDATVGTQPLRLILLALGTAVQFGPGLHFFRAGWAALRTGAPSMDTLVMLGTSAAYGYSVVATLAPGVLPAGADHVYFEAAATIITLILAGRYLEAVAKGRAGEAIRALLDLQPPTALVMRGGDPVEVPLAEVAVGDRVLVKPGARVPVDGAVVEGRSFVDESAMTGEPVPVEKEPEAVVAAGTVNGTGALTVEATAVGGQTALARIVKMVEDAQGSKPPIQALADRVVRVFVPFVLAAAAVTFAAWMLLGPDPRLTYALVASVSVLIIACPCAMGIATPISVLVGTGRAAEKGAFVREGAGLQALAEADMIVFDKTGTLTVGRPAVTDVVALHGADAAEAVRLAAAVERQSEHPIARAITSTPPTRPRRPGSRPSRATASPAPSAGGASPSAPSATSTASASRRTRPTASGPRRSRPRARRPCGSWSTARPPRSWPSPTRSSPAPAPRSTRSEPGASSSPSSPATPRRRPAPSPPGSASRPSAPRCCPTRRPTP